MTLPSGVNSEATAQLISAASKGNKEAWGTLLAMHRERLRRTVALRIDQRLQGRVDPSDVIQEACMDATRDLDQYLQNPVLPFHLWLRLLTCTRLAKTHRYHLGTQ